LLNFIAAIFEPDNKMLIAFVSNTYFLFYSLPLRRDRFLMELLLLFKLYKERDMFFANIIFHFFCFIHAHFVNGLYVVKSFLG
jgi:hypothetical protein